MPAGQRCFAGLQAASCGAGALTDSIERYWPSSDQAHRFVVITSGEPLLQLNAELIQALHACGFKIAVETNGTITPPEGIDWLCVDPKLGSQLVVHAGQELKLVYPQADGYPQQFAHMAFENFHLQPMDGPQQAANTQAAIAYRCPSRQRARLMKRPRTTDCGTCTATVFWPPCAAPNAGLCGKRSCLAALRFSVSAPVAQHAGELRRRV